MRSDPALRVPMIAQALGVSEVVVELASPPFLDAVRDAAAEGRRIEIEYWSSGRDALTSRRIDPGPPFFALGEWYTDAYCWLREGPRMFRIDRWLRDRRDEASSGGRELRDGAADRDEPLGDAMVDPVDAVGGGPQVPDRSIGFSG